MANLRIQGILSSQRQTSRAAASCAQKAVTQTLGFGQSRVPIGFTSVKIVLALMADGEHRYCSCIFNLEQGHVACCAEADDNFPKKRITRCRFAAAER